MVFADNKGLLVPAPPTCLTERASCSLRRKPLLPGLRVKEAPALTTYPLPPPLWGEHSLSLGLCSPWALPPRSREGRSQPLTAALETHIYRVTTAGRGPQESPLS